MMDIIYWPSVELILWGFLSMYLEKIQGDMANAATFLLGAVILWNVFRRSQQDVTIAFLEDIWYRNLLNLFVSPLKISEYLIGGVVVAIIKNMFVLVYMSILAFLFYQFKIFSLGFSLIPFFLNLLLFGWAVGIFISAIIFRYGTETQILAFSLAFLLQPISAVFYPLSVLPPVLQRIAEFLPLTHVFEGMRGVLAQSIFSWPHFWYATVLNIIYMLLALLFYAHLFKKVRQLGLISKVE